MIENLRKNLGPIAIGVVLSFVLLGFVLQDRNSHTNLLSRDKAVLRIDGRNYDGGEYHKLGRSSVELAMGLGMYEFLSVMGGFGGNQDPSEEFFINRMLLRDAKEEFGIHPGDDEIDTYIKEIRAFAGQDGKFDTDRYREIVEKHIGRMGMGEKDLRELAADAIACRKLGEILGAGLAPDREFLARSFALSSQQVSGASVRLDSKTFEDQIKPTDEEVKAYWETIQDSFKTEPKRKFTYFVASPQLPEVKPAEGAEAPKEEDAKVQEERRRKKREFDSKVDDFLYELEQKRGAGFEELAKAQGFEVKTTELFPASAAPADLAVNLSSSSRGGRAVDSLFDIKETSDPFSKVSDALAVGDGQWLVARLDGEEPSRVKTFDEAKDEARAQYIREKGAEALRKAADEKAAKLKEALAAGKSFADAAKELGLEAKSFDAVTAAAQPDPAQPAGLFQAAAFTDPGSLAAPVIEPAGAFLVFVAKREVPKSADANARIDSMVGQMASQNGMIALQAWLAERTNAAKVERLYQQP